MPEFKKLFCWLKVAFSKVALRVLCIAVVLLITVGIGVTWRWYSSLSVPAVSTARERVTENFTSWAGPMLKEVLFSGLPFLREQTLRPSVEVKKINRPRSLLAMVSHFLVNVDMSNPQTFLAAQIPMLNQWPMLTSAAATYIPNFPSLDTIDFISGGPLVAIYHTHTSEAYLPSYGKTHAPAGQKGDIVYVGEALSSALQKNYGIKVSHNQAVHDYPSFMKAYGPSETTAKKMLQENKSIQMVFDIHRDADKKENTTANIRGEDVARIRIIVAIGQPDLPQPHWQQNHAFAKLIEVKMNEQYPGLSRGIMLSDWRYNQNLHPRALLLEVGAQENTVDEAKRSMRLLADILAQIFRESQSF